MLNVNVQRKIFVSVVLNSNHLKEVNLTYFSHLKFTLGEVVRLFGMIAVMVVHGVIPWIWSCKFSEYINQAKMRIMIVTRQTEKKK